MISLLTLCTQFFKVFLPIFGELDGIFELFSHTPNFFRAIFHIQRTIDVRFEATETDVSRIEMARRLLQHQKAALDWSSGRQQVAFFMQMRMGKTLTAIRWASQFNLKNILVICPLSVVHVWQDELFLEHISSAALVGDWNEKRQMLEEKNVRWWLTNYESLYQRIKGKNKPSILHEVEWDCVILDESTAIRNPQALRTKMTYGLRNTFYKAILTGLPNPESSLNYYEQMAFLYGHFLYQRSYWKFRWHYYHPDKQGWNWIPNPGTLSLIKKAVNENAFVLTRKQVGMGSKKIYEKRFVFLSKGLMKEYHKAESEFELGNDLTKWILVVKMWLARLAGGFPKQLKFRSKHKINELIALFTGELKNEPVLIWFRFNNELFELTKEMKRHKLSYKTITGKDSPTKRARIRNEFRKKKFNYLLMQLKCGKFGIDCSRASVAIYYSNSFSYEERVQSEDRVINPLKKEPVLILDIITKNTIDEDIYWALRKKSANAKTFVSKIFEHMQERIKNVGLIKKAG